MAKKKPTKEERAYMSRVASLGCIICENPYVELHHIRDKTGCGMRESNYDILPLCDVHHRTGGHGVAFHAGKETWEEKHGTQRGLLEEVRKKLDEWYD